MSFLYFASPLPTREEAFDHFQTAHSVDKNDGIIELLEQFLELDVTLHSVCAKYACNDPSISQLQNDVETFKSKLASELALQLNHIDKLTEDKKLLLKALRDKESENITINEQNSASPQPEVDYSLLQAKETQILQLERKVSKLLATLEDQEKKITDISSTQLQTTHKLRIVTREKEQLETILDAMKEELSSAHGQLTSLKTKNNELEGQLVSVQESPFAYEVRQSLETEVKELTFELERAQVKLAKRKQINKELQNKVAQTKVETQVRKQGQLTESMSLHDELLNLQPCQDCTQLQTNVNTAKLKRQIRDKKRLVQVLESKVRALESEKVITESMLEKGDAFLKPWWRLW